MNSSDRHYKKTSMDTDTYELYSCLSQGSHKKITAVKLLIELDCHTHLHFL